MNYNCPNCGSENTASYQMVYHGGTSNGQFRAVSYGLNAGLIGTRGSSRNQNDLARAAAPPRRPEMTAGDYILSAGIGIAAASIISIFIGGLMPESSQGFRNLAAFSAFLAATVATGIIRNKITSDRQKYWSKQNDVWLRSWMCLRCGSSWRI